MTAVLEPLPRPKIRAVVKDDWAYILDSWKKSYRDAEPHVPAHIYWAEQHALIEAIKLRGAEFRIACDPTDDDFIWGWACVARSVLHYVFVRTSMRLNGVAGQLLVGLTPPISCSHWTASAEQIAKKNPGILIYIPSEKK